MKKLLALLIVPALMLMAGMAWGTTFTTPTIDGIITGDGVDWDTQCEDFITVIFDDAGYTLWITWDESTGVYIGLDRVDDPDNKFLGDNAEDISLFVGIDTDQIIGSGTPGDVYSTVTFGGGHMPEYIYSFAGGGGWYEWAWWDQLASAFQYNGWRDDGTYYGWFGDVNIDDELTILWNDIGNPLGIGVMVWITYEGADPWPPAVVAAWPEENPVGVLPHLTWAYEFYTGHYYYAPGVPANCPQPACDICPNITDHSVPVALSSFTATGHEGSIEVSWTSQTEVNALAYHLYRSDTECGQFDEIARIDAGGNSETPRSYSYLDENVVTGQTYYYQLADEDFEGNMKFHGTVFASASTLPGSYALLPNYPNPFNPSTAIAYQTPEAGYVTLAIYNIVGQEVRTLVDAHQDAGTYTIQWDSKDNDGQHLNSGVYFCTMKAGDFSETRKMVLMR
ncbi:FlgD immunoglobulin-like domain containing protein [Candidatus Zixiibacteriota bacterium]